MRGPFLFEWDDTNANHIARHQYRPDEVEEVFAERFVVGRGRDGRCLVYGQTSVGRMTVVVGVRKPSRVIRVITAREMSENERRRYRRK